MALLAARWHPPVSMSLLGLLLLVSCTRPAAGPTAEKGTSRTPVRTPSSSSAELPLDPQGASPDRCSDAYYAGIDTHSAGALRRTLHELIDDHRRFPYTSSSTDTWDILEEADSDPGDPGSIIDIYRNASYPKRGGGNSDYNREHTWPKSYGFVKDGTGNYPFTDCHHLFLSDSGYNSSRGNKPFGDCGGNAREKPTVATGGRGGSSSGHPGDSNWTSGQRAGGCWETWIGRRGDVARALFYLDVRYEGGIHGTTRYDEPDLILTDDVSRIRSSSANQPEAHMGLLSVLVAWHRSDPVDDLERHRNEVVFRYQGNRNPFIDHPEWVACVFGGDCEGAD